MSDPAISDLTSSLERATEVAIVGAGAAGLWAAARVARAGRRVLLIEKTPRAGTKILASGGTRCNLTTTLGPREAARLFGGPPAERFLLPAFQALPPEAVRARFLALGVPTVTEDALEKVFPASQRAVDVRDALERDARAAGAEVLLGWRVLAIERAGAGWVVDAARTAGPDGGAEAAPPARLRVRAPRLILCPGGKSYPKTGTTGDGYPWLEGLGLPVVEPVPALVPLRSPAAWARALSGVALQAALARLLDPAGRELARRARPILFTHEGLSGPAALDLSVHVARASAEARRAGRPLGAYAVAIDLLPGVDRDALQRRLEEAAHAPGAPRLARAVPELPRRLVAAVAAASGQADDNPPVNGLSRAARHALVEALKGLRVPVDGTLGFDKAEVTAGGLALEAVERKSMRVRGQPGLYAIGELLDLTGPIGGLHFQAAFACAELAGLDAARG